MNRFVNVNNLEDFTLGPMVFDRPAPVPEEDHPDLPALHNMVDAGSAEAAAFVAQLEAKAARSHAKFNRDLKVWEDLKIRFESRQSAFARVFTKHLGPTVLVMEEMADLLGRKAYFEAWHFVHEHFLRHDGTGTQEKISNILHNAFFDFSVSMMAFIQFISKMVELNELYDGGAASDGAKVSALIAAVKRGHGDFTGELKMFRVGSFHWEETKRALINHANDHTEQEKNKRVPEFKGDKSSR
jgi:hypothetical protein